MNIRDLISEIHEEDRNDFLSILLAYFVTLPWDGTEGVADLVEELRDQAERMDLPEEFRGLEIDTLCLSLADQIETRDRQGKRISFGWMLRTTLRIFGWEKRSEIDRLAGAYERFEAESSRDILSIDTLQRAFSSASERTAFQDMDLGIVLAPATLGLSLFLPRAWR